MCTSTETKRAYFLALGHQGSCAPALATSVISALVGLGLHTEQAHTAFYCHVCCVAPEKELAVATQRVPSLHKILSLQLL